MSEERITSRREFLKQGAAAGVAGAAFLSTACDRSAQERPPARGGPFIRTLGRTGIRLPVVSMGTCYGITLVRAALEKGIVYLHTSSSYAERNHERLLGRATRDLPRDSFVIATSPDLRCYRHPKGGGPSLDIGTSCDPAAIVKSLEDSLTRLGLEYVDIYYLASVGSREATRHEPYLRAYEKLKSSGKTRFVGVATHSNEPEVIRSAVETGLWDVVLTAYNFRQSHRRQIEAAIDEAAEAGLGIVAMKTQAGVYWNRTRTRKINMKAALKWALRNENVHTAIPAFANFEEMREDMSVIEDLALTRQEKRDLRIGEELGLSGLFCQQCGSCRDQCPAGVDVPALMRSRMYALGHRDVRKARQTLPPLSAAGVACTRCESCRVRCSLGLDVRSGVLELEDLLQVPEDLRA